MTHVGYVVGGYGLTALVLGAYVARLRWRSRALARTATTGSAARPSDTRADGPA